MEEKESTFPESPPVTQTVGMSMVATAAAAIDTTVSSDKNYDSNPCFGNNPSDRYCSSSEWRPRKYDADGNLRPGYNSSNDKTKGGAAPPPPPGFYLSSPPVFIFFQKRKGEAFWIRPLADFCLFSLILAGELFANTAGGDFTPRAVNVSSWEDVASKIFSISQKGRDVCVLFANGVVSNVTIRQRGSSGGILTYEGRFELLSLSGSFTVTETGGVKGRTGGLCVSLAGPDGRVICGGIAGVLAAARPIQIVVGSFMPNGYKAHKIRKHYREHTIGSPISSAPNTVIAATAISQAQPKTETRLNSRSPTPAQSHGGDADESMIQMHNTNVMSTNASWNGASVPGVSVTGA
ncbi:hypothetical protein D8674_041269 [Pyrus ussuriensis x Pyrus communis]|uniref:AT-hook motif nuclear-localized protein n=1 Tax=Pyrus ussuriensis x Pyrus communis TaxID=2448454 RepID=A0A5N5FHU4_9ROSA|nr:hypothetical protein D8674_041269 [Pyrus ussuriensis x Pyrus communis]